MCGKKNIYTLYGGERKKMHCKLVTDPVAGGAHGQIYYLI